MSRPRLFRTDTVMCALASTCAKASTWSSEGRVYGMPAASFSGSRLTLAFRPLSRRTNRRASSMVSLTPASITYSNVIRLRFFSGKLRQAAINCAREYLRLIGTSSSRWASVVAWSEMARFGM